MAWRYSANIPTYITGKDDNGEPVVLYRVNVFLQQHNQDGSDAASAQSPGTDAAAPFFVLRRYSQFRHLHDQLKSAFPAVMSGKGMAPPPKHPLVLGALGFGGGGGAGGAEARQREMLERRRAELERWIWRLIGSPEIAGSPQFKSFLEFDRALARAQQQQRRKLEAQRSSFSPGSTAGGPAGSGPPSEAGFGHTGGYPAGGGLDDSASDASGPSMAGGVSLGGASTSTSTIVPAAVPGAALGGPAGADGGLRDGDGGRQHQRGSATDAAAGTRGSPAGRAPPGSNATASLHPHAPDAVQHQRQQGLSHPSLASSFPHPAAGGGAATAGGGGGGGGGGGAVSVTGAVGMGSMAGLPTQAAAAAAGGAAACATAATPGLLRLGIHLHSRSDVRRLVELLVARLEAACTDAATASEEAVLLRDANRAMAERLGELESEVAGGGAAAQVRAVLVEAEAARAAAEQRAAQLADSLTSRTTAREHQVAALQAQLAEARAENAEMLNRLADWGVGGPPPASATAGGGGSSGAASGGGAAGGDGGAEATALRQRMEELQAELGRREGEAAERAAEAEALQARVRQLDEQLAAEAKRREQAEAAAKAAAAAAATPPPPPPPPAAPQNHAALDRARADNALLAQEVQRLRGVLAAEREAHKAAATTQAQTAAALQARVKELERAMAASGLGAGAGPAAGFGNGDSLI